jgi:hypothetical protein
MPTRVALVDRIFKRPFSLTATVSPALQAVIRNALVDDCARSMRL